MVNTTMSTTKLPVITAFISSALLLSGCNDKDNKAEEITFNDIAVVQSVASGESMIEFTDGITDVASNYNSKTATDYGIATRGEYIYHIGRYNIDTIQKYHIDNPQLGYYPGEGYSLRSAGETTSANPYNISFITDDTAVITRYGSAKAWVINLAANNSDDFLIRELDLSHHTTGEDDTVPEMDMVFTHNNRVYITLQNLTEWVSSGNEKVVVFDATSWEEIDTDSVTPGTQAIELSLANHQSGVVYGDKMYLGSLVYGPLSGGIEAVNLNDFSTEVLTDEYAVNRVTATESGKIFFTSYEGWSSEKGSSIDTLYKLNSDNSASKVSIELASGNISALASKGDVLWLGLPGTSNKIIRINAAAEFSAPKPLNEIQLSSVETALKPVQIEFLTIEQNIGDF